MNWYLSAHPTHDLNQRIEEYKAIAAEAIENWIEIVTPVEDKSEGIMIELPPRLGNGAFYYSGGYTYRYRFSTGFSVKKYGYVKLGHAPYNITIEREDPGTYAHEVGVEMPPMRIRRIESPHVIE